MKTATTALCIIVLLCTNCSPQHQLRRREARAAKHLTQALHLSKEKTARFTRDLFPCTVNHTDTIITERTETKDSLMYVTCDGGNRPNSGTSAKKLPVAVKTQYHYITKTLMQRVEDSAKIFLCEQEKVKCAQQSAAFEANVHQLKKVRNVLEVTIAILLLAIIVHQFAGRLVKAVLG